ncbi:MAG TPA: DNA mismatch repair protein MutS [Thermoplasmata archaeon]|nr:DNA mismatch repair protein MutS [Thermoplasmata archaeon]
MTDGSPPTPLMEQYEGVRAQYPGHLVLFRVGDFYETFGEDAKLLARELEVVLTARAPDREGERTPMAGVPHHAIETYLARLVQKGYKVALCDQVEDPAVAKGLVRREVTRVVTPGTVVEERILPGPDHNFLASAVLSAGGPGAFAVVDVTTGEWFDGAASAAGPEALASDLAPFAPREVLVEGPPAVTSPLVAVLRREFPSARIEVAEPAAPLPEPPEAVRPRLPVTDEQGRASARLAAYVRGTQPRLVPFLERLELVGERGRLRLDSKTLRHLEITRPMNPDDPQGATLLSTWDETVTAPGRRTLAFWLRNPLAHVAAITERQDAVEALVKRGAELLGLRSELGPVADLSRIASRVAGRRVRPPELAALRASLRSLEGARQWLAASPIGALRGTYERLTPLDDLRRRLDQALPDTPPATAEGPGLFRPGFAPELDALSQAEAEGLRELEQMERAEQEATGIRSLKVGYNQVFGYYLEVTRPHLARVPPRFRRKQTLAQAERYTTEELGRVEEAILTARSRRSESESAVWERFLTEIDAQIPGLHRLSRAVGELDALATLALLAQERGYVRPLVEDSGVLQVRDGRHPVFDRTMEGQFVPNDTDLDADGARLLVLTGPNMSGKSTYMRQVGLLVVLAQVGAFVPARYARIGVVSGLFTRMGFTDEIGRGKSSFMVEMTEVAEILRAADGRSLVLLDEVGRGTSTFDGLAIAWATLRHLHDSVRCRTLLATHYHQLTDLVEGLPGARNAHLAVRDQAGEVVFLHRLVQGSTDRSYGLHVARLAGLPTDLLKEAERLLKRLEAQGVGLPPSRSSRTGPTRYTQGVLLPATEPTVPSPLEAALRSVDPERMTPMEALRFLAEWRRRITGTSGLEGA